MKRKMSSDVWVLTALLIMLIGLGFLMGKKQGGRSDMEMLPRRTSFSSRPGGVKALYETLNKLGYPLSRTLQPFTSPPPDGVLLILQPEIPVSNAEWKALKLWTERGNLLVLASGDFMPSLEDEQPSIVSRAVCPSFLTPDVKSYRVTEDKRIEDLKWSFETPDSIAAPGG